MTTKEATTSAMQRMDDQAIRVLSRGRGLLAQAFFAGAEAEDSVDGVGGSVVGGVEVSDLELAEEADAEHLDAGEDEDAGDNEDGSVLVGDSAVTSGAELRRSGEMCSSGGLTCTEP